MTQSDMLWSKDCLSFKSKFIVLVNQRVSIPLIVEFLDVIVFKVFFLAARL